MPCPRIDHADAPVRACPKPAFEISIDAPQHIRCKTFGFCPVLPFRLTHPAIHAGTAQTKP
jgi:hypothetical protein